MATKTQHTPNPAAHEPEAEPERSAHSLLVKHVPLRGAPLRENDNVVVAVVLVVIVESSVYVLLGGVFVVAVVVVVVVVASSKYVYLLLAGGVTRLGQGRT